MKGKNQIPETNSILNELNKLKNLLILFLLKSGTSQKEIALALGVDQGTVSRILPSNKIKKFKEKD